MKTFLIATTCIIATIFAYPANAADKDASTRIHDAQSGFSVLLSLEGIWEGEALVVPKGESKVNGVKSKTKVTYKPFANASSVRATFAEGTNMEMESIYHMDGPEALVHTHYCAVGNQPTMRFEKNDEPGVINFEFSKGSNMDVNKDGHVHAGYIRVIDENTIETETDLWRDGKSASTRYTRLTRKK